MEDSILKSTKQILGLDGEDDAFDIDVLTHINSAFSTLDQIGVPAVFIESDSETWSDLDLHPNLLALVRSYVPLKVSMFWDPPTIGFLITMKEKQLDEFEWRINSFQELEAT